MLIFCSKDVQMVVENLPAMFNVEDLDLDPEMLISVNWIQSKMD
jgi:hypothetical protein